MRTLSLKIAKVIVVIFVISLLSQMFSCDDSKPYKRFSLKNLFGIDSTDQYNDSIAKVRELLNADYKEKKLKKLFDKKSRWNNFNGCVLIAQQGYVIYKNAYGYANKKQKNDLTTKTSFNLASTTKTYTAAAIMLLKQQNKLSYDDTITKYIPDFPYKNITIKQLLCHRSGLPNYMYFSYVYFDEYGKQFNNNRLVEMMVKHKPEAYLRPNKRFQYSNTNYALLAVIIEKVSGMSYEEFMRTKIFEPLKMENTWVNIPTNYSKYTNRTTAYSGYWRVEEPDFLDSIVGDKGIFSNVEDMFKWDQSFYNNKLLTKETIEEAFTGQNKERKGMNNYGYGFRVIDNKKTGKSVYHNGWWHCYNTTFYRRLSDKTTIIILSNKYNKSVYNVSDILEIIDGKIDETDIQLE